MKTIYLSGPMTGLPDFNRPTFYTKAAELRAKGYEVICPPELPGEDDHKPWLWFMRRDIKALMDADALAMLPGWRKSKGASLEAQIGLGLGLPILNADTLEPEAETVLQEAQRLVYGNRGASYGHPFDDFSRTAAIWSAILGTKVQPDQVALCMIGVKVSRECNKPGRDNATDIAGYAGTLEMVRQKQGAY